MSKQPFCFFLLLLLASTLMTTGQQQSTVTGVILDLSKNPVAGASVAMSDQGFTPNAQDVQTLSAQRVWYDKKAPDFGQGN